MITFDNFCKAKKIVHLKEAFYHWVMANSPAFINEEILEGEWQKFLTHVTEGTLGKAA